MLLDNDALCMHLYLLLCSKVRCLPDVSDPFVGQYFLGLACSNDRDGAMWMSWGKDKSFAV